MEKEHIHIFRTSVENTSEINKLSPLLDRIAGEDGKWNFDLEDCDRILRVESLEMHPGQIRMLLKSQGYFIEELMD